MKVTVTIDAKQQLINVLGENPTVKLNQIRTTG
jgi:hypothetical protein